MAKVGNIGNDAPVQVMSQIAGSKGSGGVVEHNGKRYVLTNEHVVNGATNKQGNQIASGAPSNNASDKFSSNAELIQNNPTIKIGGLEFQGAKTVVEKRADLALIEIPPDKVDAVLAQVEPSKLPKIGEKPQEGSLEAQKPSPGGQPQENSKITNRETVVTSSGVTSSKLRLNEADVKAGTSGTNVNGESATDGKKTTFDVINSTTGSPSAAQNEAVGTQLNTDTGQKALSAMFAKLGERFDTNA